MSIQVNDFRWEPGKNDAEYIRLLESSRNEWQKIAQKAIAKLKALSKAQEPRVIVGTELTDTELIEEIRKAPIVLKPNVDAVPVVRCQDCKHYNITGCGDGFGWCEDTIVNTGVWDNFYCADGERRDDNAAD